MMGAKMSNITVLTPTYNRGKLLEKLYESLCAQDCKDFEWLIVDDGSTDDTSERVEQMKQTANFPIFIIKRKWWKAYGSELCISVYTDSVDVYC